MNQELKNSINAYVSLLPDMYSSPNDDYRLMRIAYEFETTEARFDDELKSFFVDTLSQKFKDYSKEFIEEFYQERKKQIESFAYVIGGLKTMNLLK